MDARFPGCLELVTEGGQKKEAPDVTMTHRCWKSSKTHPIPKRLEPSIAGYAE